MSQRGTSCLGLVCAILGLGLLGGGLISGVGAGWLGGADDGLCGPLASDLTLTLEQSPFTVTCAVTVEAGATLEVEPGVELRFEPGTALAVQGRMLALGTVSQPVILTSGSSWPQPGDWAGLVLAGTEDSRLEWCVVEYASAGVRVLAEGGATVRPVLANCTVRHQALHGIVVEAIPIDCAASRAEPTILGSTIESNGGCGVYGYGHGHPTAGCEPPVAGLVGGRIAESTIQQNLFTGVCLRTKEEYNSGGDVGMAVERNRILANDGHGLRLYGEEAVHPRIENNLIQGNAGSGLVWEAVDGGRDLPVVNNTIVGNGGAGIWSGGPASRMLVTNNIVAGNIGYGLFCASDEEPVRSTNDLWQNEAGAYSGCTPGMTDLTEDPLFVDPEAGDWTLRFGSPCIDAGTAHGAPVVDLEGRARPQGDGFDVGAYEFSAAQIEVRSEGVGVPAGSEYDVGTVAVGSALETPFAIGNVGGSGLVVDAITIEPLGDYTLVLSEPLPLLVRPGSSTMIGIRFAPTSTGRQTATVAIGSDDPDDTPYVFGVSGMGVQPLVELGVSGPTNGLIGSVYWFTATAAPQGASLPVTYTWQAQGQQLQVNSDGLTDAISYAWGMPGVQGITVTGENVAAAVSATHRVTLHTPVEADFTASPRSGRIPLVVVFTNTSTGDWDRNWWEFGDRTTSTLHSPTHIYRTLGAHTVTLRVAGPGGTGVETRPAHIKVRGLVLHLPLVMRGMGEG